MRKQIRTRFALYTFYAAVALLFWVFGLNLLALLFGIPVALALGIGFGILVGSSINRQIKKRSKIKGRGRSNATAEGNESNKNYRSQWEEAYVKREQEANLKMIKETIPEIMEMFEKKDN